ncbi:hypothetical protein A1D29_10025 [Pasteurellaceae bacterium Orientalotternb1]|nr:hypothetical protein A1D29_10025 [Pasteurellaceae bacterium Orientalotternb1]
MYQLLTAHSFFNLARAFIGAVLMIYLLDQQIPLETILLAKSLQLLVSVVANYHAGKISDRFGKKTAVLLSCVCSLIYFYLMIDPTETKVIIGEMFNGLCIAFYMGAYEAWLFEFKNQRESRFSLISRSAEVFFLSSILATIIGALYFSQALYFSLIFMGVAIVAYAITPQKPSPSAALATHLWQDLKRFFSKGNGTLWFYLLFAGSMQIVYQFWAVFASRNLGFANEQLGYVLSLMFGMQWLFSWISRRIRLNQKRYGNFTALSGVMIFSLLTISSYTLNFSLYFTLFCFLLFVGFCGLCGNLYFAQSCQCFTEQHSESSMISLIDASGRIIGAIYFAIFSGIATENVPYVWGVFSLLVVGYFVICKKFAGTDRL